MDDTEFFGRYLDEEADILGIGGGAVLTEGQVISKFGLTSDGSGRIALWVRDLIVADIDVEENKISYYMSGAPRLLGQPWDSGGFLLRPTPIEDSG